MPPLQENRKHPLAVSCLPCGKRILACFLLLWASCSVWAAPAGKFKTENVIVVVIDGVRFSETWGKPENIPFMANVLAPEGILLSNFYNNGKTNTTAGHTALTTGFYQKIDNGGKEYPKNPSFLQAWRKHAQAGPEKAWLITMKDKLAVLADCATPPWKGANLPSAWCGKDGKGLHGGYGADKETTAAVLRILKEKHPNVVFVNLAETDGFGHAGNFDKYIKALKAADAFTGQLWSFLQEDPFYKDRTALFITHDHGRHSDGMGGFTHHGCACEGCRHLMLLALGPDFKKNARVEDRSEQIDLSATLARLLGFEMPEGKGRVLMELMQ